MTEKKIGRPRLRPEGSPLPPRHRLTLEVQPRSLALLRLLSGVNRLTPRKLIEKLLQQEFEAQLKTNPELKGLLQPGTIDEVSPPKKGA